MAKTPNHDYNIPGQGDENWHAPLNENFEAFEVDIELRDQEGNLSNYTPTAGAKFLATDTGLVYVGDGNNWVARFAFAKYDPTVDEAMLTRTLNVPMLSGSITGGTQLTDIAGNNLSIDSNGQLNASTESGGISNLSGGEGIDPGSIGDGDTVSVAWSDANDLDSDGNVTSSGGGISNLSGGEGIDPGSIGDGDTVSVAWGDANDLNEAGAISDWSGAVDLDALGEVNSLSGSVTGGTQLTDIAGNNLSIDSNGQLNASTENGGISSLSGGEGIDPGSIGDGDTLSVAWSDANDLDSDGNVTSSGGGISNLSGGEGVDPDSIGDGDTVSVAWGDANDLNGAGAVTSLSGSVTGGTQLTDIAGNNLSIDSNGQLNASTESGGISSLSGGDGIEPGSIGDGDALSVAWGDAAGLGSNGEITGGNWTTGGGYLQPSDSNVDGIDVDELRAPLLAAPGTSFEIFVNGTRALNLTAESGGDAGNVVAGYSANGTDTGVTGAVIGGGGREGSTGQQPNRVTASYGTIGGGASNTINGQWGTVSGGQNNTAEGPGSTVGGGIENRALGHNSTVAGGAPSDFSSITGTRNIAADSYCTVGGGSNNLAGSEDGETHTDSHATVSGGDDNKATAIGATIGGGVSNHASGPHAVVSGGYINKAKDGTSTIGGGFANIANADSATVAGGNKNEASGNSATVGGGQYNTASSREATVPGGKSGAAESTNSYVWNDATAHHQVPVYAGADREGLSSDKTVTSDGSDPTGSNTFSVSATGGVRFITGSADTPNVTYIPGDSAGWTAASSRTMKTNINPVKPQKALAGVNEMEIATWEYKSGENKGKGTTHIGPMAEAFHNAFDVGSSDKHINSINADGVALAAIQGLSAELDETREELDDRDERIEELESEIAVKDEKIADLETRLAAVEEQLGGDS